MLRSLRSITRKTEMRLKYAVIFIVSFWINRIASESGSLIIDGTKRIIWYSEPFEHKCLNDCPHEVEHSQFGEVSIMKRNCSVTCSGKATVHHQYRKEQYKRIQIMNAQTGARSECLIGILGEDIFCATISITSGIRQWNIDQSNRCRRKNFRYFLARSVCDNAPHYEVGEESCMEACIVDRYIGGQSHITLEAGRQRAHFRVCYDGMVAENTPGGSRGRFWHFCRAEMTSCSACFRWGNWILVTPCSSTCGAKGVVTFVRSCEIKDRSGIYRHSITYKKVANGYCIAYFGGTDTKTEPCNPNTACPGWTQWGPWRGCPKITPTKSANGRSNDGKQTGKCKTARKRRSSGYPENTKEAEKNITSTAFSKNIIVKPTLAIQFAVNDSVRDYKVAPQTLKGAERRGYRTRHCWPMRGRRCAGNSTEYGSCDDINKEKSSKKQEEIDDCDVKTNTTNTETTEKTLLTTTSETATLQPNVNVATTEIRVINKVRTETSTTTTKYVDNKNRRDNNFTLTDEDGFTSIINDYAPALIAGLLVFIVLLLIALIAICGYRIMLKKNRRTPTPPSFSAGTMGSIPSGLVQGFSHILGLRHGSGTFGRSESTINEVGHVNEAQINSNKNIANGGHATKGKSAQLPVSSSSQIAAISGGDYNNSHHSQAMEIGAASKVTSLPTASASQAFHPLPPIPSHQRIGNGVSVFQRGAGRSSSLNPTVNNQNSHRENSQPRAESVSGRISGHQYSGTGSSWHRDRKLPTEATVMNKRNTRRSDTSSNMYCEHDCSSSTCGDKEKHSGAVKENEYWSVTRDQCFDSTTQSRDRNTSVNSIVQADNTRTKFRTERFKSGNALGEDKEHDTNEMVDNVLYSVASGIHFSRGKDFEDVTEKNEKETEITMTRKQFYNKIEAERASQGSEIDTSTSTEDDYDHLCDQFGGPPTGQREKHPGTMTSLHQLRHNSIADLDEQNTNHVNLHDYECIEFDEDEDASDKESTQKRRAASNEYATTDSTI